MRPAKPGATLSRRAFHAIMLAAAGAPLLALREGSCEAAVGDTAPRPFEVHIPQATIDRILLRVREAQWPQRLDAADWRYGADWDYMKSLAQYWVDQFDWRKAEAGLNRYPQFVSRVGDFDIHFIMSGDAGRNRCR
jgi:hypothetical protein